MVYSISITARTAGAKATLFPQTATFEHGYRAYSRGPSCVQVRGLDEEGEETLFLDIPDRIAREFAEGILKVLDLEMNQKHAIG